MKHTQPTESKCDAIMRYYYRICQYTVKNILIFYFIEHSSESLSFEPIREYIFFFELYEEHRKNWWIFGIHEIVEMTMNTQKKKKNFKHIRNVLQQARWMDRKPCWPYRKQSRNENFLFLFMQSKCHFRWCFLRKSMQFVCWFWSTCTSHGNKQIWSFIYIHYLRLLINWMKRRVSPQ